MIWKIKKNCFTDEKKCHRVLDQISSVGLEHMNLVALFVRRLSLSLLNFFFFFFFQMEYGLMQPANISQSTVTPSVLAITSDQSHNASSTMSSFDPDQSSAYVIMRRLQTILIPVICLLGIVGNVLAAGIFLSPSLSKTSCCFHLASKSINDIGFLVSLFVVWLFRLKVPLFTTPGVCQITVFLTYVCGCLSVWFVVGITMENFIRFTQPSLVHKYCNVAMAKRMVAGVTATSALFYNFSLWTTGVMVGPDGSKHCTSLLHFQSIVMATTVIDTALTLILPSILMFFLIVSIVFKSIESFERKKRLRASATTQRGQKKRLTPEGKMTTFLFVISVIFLALNLPTHAIRLKLLIQVYIQHQHPSYADVILQRVFEILLYFNFSTNCLIYLLFGERFRAVFVSMYLGRCWPQKYKKTKEASGTTELSDATPIMMKQRTADKDDSGCLTCHSYQGNDLATNP